MEVLISLLIAKTTIFSGTSDVGSSPANSSASIALSLATSILRKVIFILAWILASSIALFPASLAIFSMHSSNLLLLLCSLSSFGTDPEVSISRVLYLLSAMCNFSPAFLTKFLSNACLLDMVLLRNLSVSDVRIFASVALCTPS